MAAEDKVPEAISATLVSVAVNCGDHAQDIHRSVEVNPDDTVRDLMERVIEAGKWSPRKYDDHVVLRFIQPAPRHAEAASTVEPF
jgi:hypothetical protein